MDNVLKIRDLLRASEEEAERLERVALAYVLSALNSRLADLEERGCELEIPPFQVRIVK